MTVLRRGRNLIRMLSSFPTTISFSSYKTLLQYYFSRLYIFFLCWPKLCKWCFTINWRKKTNLQKISVLSYHVFLTIIYEMSVFINCRGWNMAGGCCRIAVLRFESRPVLPFYRQTATQTAEPVLFNSFWGAGSWWWRKIIAVDLLSSSLLKMRKSEKENMSSCCP